jgi:cell division protease FtsH
VCLLQVLDAALLRPGRFDRIVAVRPPDAAGREATLRVHMRRVRCGADVQPQLYAARTDGCTGAHLANVVVCACVAPTRVSCLHVCRRADVLLLFRRMRRRCSL